MSCKVCELRNTRIDKALKDMQLLHKNLNTGEWKIVPDGKKDIIIDSKTRKKVYKQTKAC